MAKNITNGAFFLTLNTKYLSRGREEYYTCSTTPATVKLEVCKNLDFRWGAGGISKGIGNRK